MKNLNIINWFECIGLLTIFAYAVATVKMIRGISSLEIALKLRIVKRVNSIATQFQVSSTIEWSR